MTRKLEPHLFIDIPFDESMRRFMQTDPKEVEELPGKKKTAKPKPDGHLTNIDSPSGEAD